MESGEAGHLQTAAHQVGTDLGTPINGLGQLQSENETAVAEAVAWGNEGGAQVIDGPGKAALDDAMQLGQQVQDKLDEYVAAVEQAKGAGGG
ncbi:MAG TPA: hypothetical protein VF053_22175 [Streptosporangiales bacterium]